jgi:hypothetical protein
MSELHLDLGAVAPLVLTLAVEEPVAEQPFVEPAVYELHFTLPVVSGSVAVAPRLVVGED